MEATREQRLRVLRELRLSKLRQLLEDLSTMLAAGLRNERSSNPEIVSIKESVVAADLVDWSSKVAEIAALCKPDCLDVLPLTFKLTEKEEAWLSGEDPLTEQG